MKKMKTWSDCLSGQGQGDKPSRGSVIATNDLLQNLSNCRNDYL